MRRLLVALFGLLLGGVLFAAPAWAHATLVTSDPGDGARLKSAPHTVTLSFDENVALGAVGYVHTVDQNGARVDARPAYHPGGDASRVADDLKSDLPDGTYTVSFRIVSADSHPVAGTIRFVVGNGPLLAARTAGGGATVDHATSGLFDVARWLSYGGLALLGGAWLALTVWPAGRDERRAVRLVACGWMASVIGALAQLVLDGPYTAGTGPSDAFGWALLDGTLHEHFGELVSLRLVLLGALALLLGRALQPRAPSRLETAVWPLAIGMALTFADAGHADTTSPRWLSVLLDGLHVLAMTAWLGGLVMLVLAVLPRRAPDELRAVLPAFSRVAFSAVAVLGITGTYAAWRGVGSWDAVFDTTYGWLVDTKVLLFLGVLGLGNVSRLLVQRFRPDRLGGVVATEALLGVGVLAVTAVLVAQPRGNEALAAQYREPVTGVAPLGGGRSATVTVDPGTHGSVTVTVELSAGTRATSVTASAIDKAAQLGPIPVKLSAAGRDLYTASQVNLPVAGEWEIDLDIASSDFAATTTDVTLTLH
jgi:copper transport protein